MRRGAINALPFGGLGGSPFHIGARRSGRRISPITVANRHRRLFIHDRDRSSWARIHRRDAPNQPRRGHQRRWRKALAAQPHRQACVVSVNELVVRIVGAGSIGTTHSRVAVARAVNAAIDSRSSRVGPCGRCAWSRERGRIRRRPWRSRHEEVARVDRDQPISDARTMDSGSAARCRAGFSMVLLALDWRSPWPRSSRHRRLLGDGADA